MKSILLKNYNKLKTQYPDCVIWFSFFGYVEVISDSAIETSKILGTILTHRKDNNLPLTGFKNTDLQLNLNKMIKNGKKVAIVSTN